MRKTLAASIGALCLAALPAFAQQPYRPAPYRPMPPGQLDPQNPTGGVAPADQYPGVPPTSAYQGGAGSPRSNAASNVDPANTQSVIAPRLPSPDTAGNSPQDFLAAARRALDRRQTGAAQEALERAETRVLTRSTDASAANQPDDSRIVQAIAAARRALATRNIPAARAAIDAVLGPA